MENYIAPHWKFITLLLSWSHKILSTLIYISRCSHVHECCVREATLDIFLFIIKKLSLLARHMEDDGKMHFNELKKSICHLRIVGETNVQSMRLSGLDLESKLIKGPFKYYVMFEGVGRVEDFVPINFYTSKNRPFSVTRRNGSPKIVNFTSRNIWMAPKTEANAH